MRLTEQQAEAVHLHQRSVTVTAGAGSGKTGVLVERFLALLAANPSWPLASIVAITFTEKAAREMRSRIREEVARRAQSDDAAERAFWLGHLAALDSARIGTIHALCAMLLRANAAALGLDPGFTVLEEADAWLLQAEAIEQALAETVAIQDGHTRPEAALFETFSPREVRAALARCFTLDVSGTPADWETLYAGVEARYAENFRRVIGELRADAAFVAALDWAPPHPVDPGDPLGRVWEAIHANRTDILNAEFMLVNKALRAVAASGFRKNAGRADKWPGTKDEALRQIGLVVARCKEALTAIGDLNPAVERRAAELAVCWARVIERTQRVYRERKADRHALDFNDLETLARDLLRSEAVQARYQGAEFNHLMVDEFQDTNRAQQAIVYALSGLTRPGSLFVVGDPKQSIYRFRGAQNEVFDEVRHDIERAGGQRLALSTSFRTHAPLIDVINGLFAPLIPDYEPMTAARSDPPADGPALEVLAIRGAALADLKLPADAGARRTWEAAELAARIRALVAEGHPTWDKARSVVRPAGFGDFAVLVRSYLAMPFVEEALRAAQIPYVTVAGRGFFDQQEVTDLLSLLGALYNHADNLALAVALRSPLFSLSDDALFALRLSAADYPMLWDAVHNAESTEPFDLLDPIDSDAIRFAQAVLAALAALAGRASVAELLTEALDRTAYLAALAGLPDGDRKVSNVLKLLEVARASDQIALGDFTLYIERLRAAEAREGEAPLESDGAVQIMTVHAAKGLEFPIVCLFDTAAAGRAQDGGLIRWDAAFGLACKVPRAPGDEGEENGDNGDKQDSRYRIPYLYRAIEKHEKEADAAEQIRLLYVAMTRAQDHLIISGNYEKNRPELSWLGRIAKHFGLPADPQAQESVIGPVLYRVPPAPPAAPESRSAAQPGAAPNGPTGNADRDPENVEPLAPPLLAPVPRFDDALAQTIDATDLAALSRDPVGFRLHVLHDAPLHDPNTAITPGAVPARGNVEQAAVLNGRLLGEIVHEALQALPIGSEDEALLRRKVLSAIRARAINAEEQIEALSAEAIHLVAQTWASPLWDEVRAAREWFREYPFLYRAGGRMVSGKIDLLYRGRAGWTIVDFKTDAIRPGAEYRRAERYVLQLSVYAGAVRAAVGVSPRVLIHFVRTARTVTVEESTWRMALSDLDARLHAAFAPDSP